MSRTTKIISAVVASLALSLGSVGFMGATQLTPDMGRMTVHCC